MGLAAILYDGFWTFHNGFEINACSKSSEKYQKIANVLRSKMGMELPVKVYRSDSPNTLGEVRGGCILILNEEFFEGKFDPTFTIAHEISHLKNQDRLKGFVTATVVAIASALLCLPFWGYWIAECVGNIFFIVTKFSYVRASEKIAEFDAIKVTGAAEKKEQIRLYKYLQEKNKKWDLDNQGNDPLDLTHPPLSERIKLIESFLN